MRGEFALIDAFRDALGAAASSPRLLVGSGDDAAVDGPCADPGERDKVTQFLTYLHSGSAHH